MDRKEQRGARSRPFLITALIIGLGLALAPLAFQMFSRAPKGGDMLDGFRPYMNEATIVGFQADMDRIDTAVTEAGEVLDPMIEENLGLAGAELADEYASYVAFVDQWDAIYVEMSDMLVTMADNIDNFAAVDALPPFALFPWFFVMPGLLIAGASVWGLVSCRRGRSCRGPGIALGVLGIGLILAPAVFQMFSRAPLGGDMIDDFESLMTEEKIQEIQGYFLVIGSGEGTIRAQILPVLVEKDATSLESLSDDLPALTEFFDTWPSTSNEMAPMIGAMSDNLDNYLAVAALPPFPLFPWFFVIPGILIVGLAFAVGRRRDGSDETDLDIETPLPQGGTS